MDLELAGKVAFVTGGSGGIGRAIAKAFAAEGAAVALTYHQHEVAAKQVTDEITGRGGTALPVSLDLTLAASIRSAVQRVVDAWGGVDTLVVNASPAAGPSPDPKRFEDVPVPAWQGQLRAEVEGAFHLTQAVVPLMRAQHCGRLVFISASVVGRGFPGEEAYIASKLALHGLSRTLATEVYADGVLCNVVAPGPTITPNLLSKVAPQVRAEVIAQGPAAGRAALEKAMPQLRFSTADEVARVVTFLGSPANGNVSGAVVDVSGGM
jgi:3-oxoacyl-[acyl-carrier protein] reductase